MGWSGHGIYDGDSTFSTQISMIEKAGYKNDKLVPLRNGSEAEAWELSEKELVSNEVLEKVYKNFDKLAKAEGISKALATKNQDALELLYLKTHYGVQTHLIPVTMMADFFLRHQAQMPGNLQEKAIEATYLLIDSQHTKDFNSPTRRRNALKKHLEALESFDPVITLKRDGTPKFPKEEAAAPNAKSTKLLRHVSSMPAPALTTKSRRMGR